MNVGERFRKQFVLAIVFLFALSGFFGIIGVGDDVEPQGGMYGGELRVALQRDIEENPLLAVNDASLLASSLMYDSLAKIDEVTLLAEPWVAINWTLTSDTSVEVKFRTDVEWHDSTDASPHYISGTDICYTYNTAMKSSPIWGTLLQNVVCSEVGSDTVAFDLSTADDARGVFFSKLLTMPIVPNGFTGGAESGSGPYKFGERGTTNFNITDDPVVENAIAGQRYAIAALHYHYIEDAIYDTVSFELLRDDSVMPSSSYTVEWSNGTISFNSPLSAGDNITANYDITSKYTTLVANENHFIQRPYLDEITYTFFPDDLGTEFDEATDGAVKAMIDNLVDFIGFEIQMGSQNALRWEGGQDETTLSVTPHVSVQTTNPKLTLLYVGTNTPLSPLNDTEFRKGLSMSIKRELARSFEASTTIADSMIHPSNAFWHNATCPQFRIPKDEDNQPILTDIINHFQDNGYLDSNDDGYLEDRDGNLISMTLFVPPTTEDPSKAAIGGQAIGEVYNDVGIRTETIYLPSDQILDEVNNDNFWLYLSTVDVEFDPIFLYDMFHKDGTRNMVNLDDPYLNDILDNVRTLLDQDVRQDYVKHAVCYIAETAPVGTILHYTVLESFEKLKYEGWVQMTNGVNNFWSYMGVHYQQLGPMKAQIILLVDSIKSGEILDVVVSATNLEDVPLSNAWVKVTNDYASDYVINYTDDTGQMSFNWTGPDVTISTTVTFTATVRIPQYDEAIAEASVTVHPDLLDMLVIIAMEDNFLDSGDNTNVIVEVTDDFGIGIPDATVLITISPEGAGGSVEEFSGLTGPTGQFLTEFTADVSVSQQFNLRASASKSGYNTVESQPDSVIVEPTGGAVQGQELLYVVLILVVILVIMILLLAFRRMRAGEGEELEEEFEEEELEEEPEEVGEEFEEEAEVEIEE